MSNGSRPSDSGHRIASGSEESKLMMEAVEAAAHRLVEGELVAFPTETVYGLGADAENPDAVARIYAAKGRPSNHPVIVHVAPDADLAYWARNIPDEARALVKAFWPGPLTLILPRAANIPAAVSGGQDSIGLRCPSHPVAQALLRRFAELKGGQGGVAAPSANKFGQVSPTLATHVRDEFPELVEAGMPVLEGGPAEVGIESTIVDLSRLEEGVGPVLLRPGHITVEAMQAVLGVRPARPDAAAPRVSGSLKAHYAPRTPLRLVPRSELEAVLADVTAEGRKAVAVVFEPSLAGEVKLPDVSWQVCASDPADYARRLYALLRELDEGGYDCIVMEQPPATAAWQAVNDRLGRAAAAFGG